jgi:hypothetical protein
MRHPRNPLQLPQRRAYDVLGDRQFDRLLGASGCLVYDSPRPKYEFLQYAVDKGDVLLHGSNRRDIEEFLPREQTTYHGRLTRGVFATPDPIWPLFFAVTDLAAANSRFNACMLPPVTGLAGTRYFFSVGCAPDDAWIDGAVYLLPRDTFVVSDEPSEWVSAAPVRPLASLHVEPADFPFATRVFRHRAGEADWVRLLRLAGNGARQFRRTRLARCTPRL